MGVNKAAQVLGEKRRTVEAWLYRERYPRPETARKIVERTKGRVTLAGIYGSLQ